MRRLLGYGWPTALVSACCVGLALTNVFRLPVGACAAALCAAAIAAAFCDEYARLALAVVVMVLAGTWWGGIRLAALDRSVLAPRIGQRGDALVAVTGPVRHGLYTLRMPAEVRRFRGERMHEAVLLELPLGRAPPQGALLELQARPVAPRGPETGFDERGWLARHGVHVVLRGGNPRIVGRRGGIGGVADRLHRHVASALASGASGERLALLDGVVLGDDDGLDAKLKADFKASGLYHLLSVDQ
jgi:predicted membrane metal-binding protein